MIPPVLPIYRRTDFAITHGEGAYLWDEHGKKYLDFAAGIAVNALGHCHSHVVKALEVQARKLWHISNMYRQPELERLAQRLVDATFADTVFFTNSGAEAVETGVKMVRKYFYAHGKPEKTRIITFEGGFHGRSITAISATRNPKTTEGFAPLLEGFDVVPWGDHDALRAAITPQTAGILIEPIQGEGGIRALPAPCLQGLRALCDEHDLLLFLDEVQCGMGRSGMLFVHEYAGVTPDIMAVAKGIGNGFPLGACLATEKAALPMGLGSHGGTYGGNPLAMAVGNAVLDIILANGFLDQAAAVGAQLKARLEQLARDYPAIIAEVRGMGLMLGLKCTGPSLPLVERLRERGLLTAPANDHVIRILPPLIIQRRHVEEAMVILNAACHDLA